MLIWSQNIKLKFWSTIYIPGINLKDDIMYIDYNN